MNMKGNPRRRRINGVHSTLHCTSISIHNVTMGATEDHRFATDANTRCCLRKIRGCQLVMTYKKAVFDGHKRYRLSSSSRSAPFYFARVAYSKHNFHFSLKEGNHR
jgi:hypothetical protein